MQPNQLFVDMDQEVVFAPINGQPVPLSIHTIKNVTQPDPDNHCHYLRINFFTAGLVSPSAWVVLEKGVRVGVVVMGAAFFSGSIQRGLCFALLCFASLCFASLG